MASFVPIPPVPYSGASDWQVRTLGALKQNVELLCAIRGEQDLASAAVLKGGIATSQITVANIVVARTLPLYIMDQWAGFNLDYLSYDSNSASIPLVINAAAKYSDAALLLQELKNLREAVINLSSILRS
jgi:hypothetical protein